MKIEKKKKRNCQNIEKMKREINKKIPRLKLKTKPSNETVNKKVKTKPSNETVNKKGEN